MRSIFSIQYTSVIEEGYSLCQIKFKTGIGRSAMENIKKEIDNDKEKNILPSSL